MEKAYAKNAEQLYIAVTSEVDVNETARNQVLAATVNVRVNVAMTKNMYFCGERLGRIAYGDSERMCAAVVRREWICDRSRGPVDRLLGDVIRRKRNCIGPINDHDEWWR
jgi:hypothetical protein